MGDDNKPVAVDTRVSTKQQRMFQSWRRSHCHLQTALHLT